MPRLIPLIESQTIPHHPIITSGLGCMVPGINLRNTAIDNTNTDPWKVSALWGDDNQIALLAKGIDAMLAKMPPTQRVLQAGPLYTFDVPLATVRGALWNIARHLTIKPTHVYLDWETTLPHTEDYQFVYDVFAKTLIEANMHGLPFAWDFANVRSGYQGLQRNRPALDVLCSHFSYTTADRETTLRMIEELTECQGPKVVHLSTACPPEENKIRWNECLRLLNPLTDAVIIFPDGKDYMNPNADNSLEAGLKRVPSMLLALMPMISATTYDQKVSP